jgi:hypothetical protein
MSNFGLIKQGEPARLFPIVADSSRENRLTSVLLASLTAIQALAEDLLTGIAPPFRKTSKTSCLTEVVFKKGETGRDRPDGLIIVENRLRSWTAIVEAKVGKADLDPTQVEKYLALARDNGVDAVITISNQFVSRVDHCPVGVQGCEKVKRFHLSWSQIQTSCALLGMGDTVEDATQSFILSELDMLLSEPKAGVERFTNMGAGWKAVTQAIADQAHLQGSDLHVQDAVRSWHQETRDLGLQISRHLGKLVSEKVERKHLSDPDLRIQEQAQILAKESCLTAEFNIPDAASILSLRADLLRKNLTVSMRVRAPEDRKTLSGRVNWLLKMIDSTDKRLILRAYWPGRAPYTQMPLMDVREDAEVLIGGGKTMLPTSFEVLLVEDLGRRFSGQQTFIQDLERVVPEFYDIIGQNLREWHPEPPKPIVNPGRNATCIRRAHFLWLGGIEGILTNPSNDPVVVMGALLRLRSRISDFEESLAPDCVKPVLGADVDPISLRATLSNICVELEAWSETVELEVPDVEDHFLGFYFAVNRPGDLSPEEVVDMDERSNHYIISNSARVKGVIGQKEG